MGFPGGTSGKEPTCQWRRHKSHGFSPWVRKIPRRRAWQPTVFLPGESLGQWPLDWWAIVHGVTKSQTWLKQLNRHACILVLGSSLYTKMFDFTVNSFFYPPKQVRETSNFSPTFQLEKLFLLGEEGVEMQEILVCCGCWNMCIISPVMRRAWRGYTLTVSNAHMCNLDYLESY